MTKRAFVYVCAAVAAGSAAPQFVSFTASPAMGVVGQFEPLPKWEYVALKRISLQGPVTVDPAGLKPDSVTGTDLAGISGSLMNKFGDDGWELCAGFAAANNMVPARFDLRQLRDAQAREGSRVGETHPAVSLSLHANERVMVEHGRAFLP